MWTPVPRPASCASVDGTVNLYFGSYEPDAHGVPLDDVVLRVATEDDLVACGELVARREGSDADAVTERLRHVHDDRDQVVMVADLHGEVVGYARASRLTPVADGGSNAPDGWYLSGLVVAPEYRRRGIGRSLTEARCEWVWERADAVHYVVSGSNRASQDMHASLGFREVTRDFSVPGVVFSHGGGVLCRAEAPTRRLVTFPRRWAATVGR